MAMARAVNWVEQGLVPDSVVRMGIRRLLRERLAEVRADDAEAAAALGEVFFADLSQAPLAPLPEKANAQHYEVPAAFFAAVLGWHRKYSCCLWDASTRTLDDAEAAALRATCERAGLADGQRVLELGCGWGSLSLWMAENYPHSQITAVSNSVSQRLAIEELARHRGLSNLQVITQDFNHFDTPERFDRVVSVEMFEHLRNWPTAFRRVAGWLVPGGHFFMHVFAHGGAPYAFVERDASDWMSSHFFSGGMMPSDDLALRCQDDLRLLQRWRWDGRHYQQTAEAWLTRMDERRDEMAPLFAATYGQDAERWWMRWRLFFMSVAELFGFDEGQRWWVSHYLFEKRP
ncbi:SAM-dependent methyltransferase [Uliginosibacterium sp. H1]|uniref:SAM-dependent methyltransferase n=1 Tax=Uliginosibacterium sp. H1 TaxID=3114757 RepID=UPI002E190BB0|nr:cyclopropane-fatty-acyl-phospholipid synthase family protein [Uliginosibacterium sp. H1]